MNYTESEKTVLPIYEAARQRKDLRVLIYNGDTDPGINSMVTQSKYTAYFDSLNVSETEAWRPWTTDGKQRMGGYVTTWEGELCCCCCCCCCCCRAASVVVVVNTSILFNSLACF